MEVGPFQAPQDPSSRFVQAHVSSYLLCSNASAISGHSKQVLSSISFINLLTSGALPVLAMSTMRAHIFRLAITSQDVLYPCCQAIAFHLSHTSCLISPKISSESFFTSPGPPC